MYLKLRPQFKTMNETCCFRCVFCSDTQIFSKGIKQGSVCYSQKTMYLYFSCSVETLQLGQLVQ